MDYVTIPNKIKLSDINKDTVSFSPHNYKSVFINSTKKLTVREFLDKEPMKGIEVGSASYIGKSYKFFIRTKALQQQNFLLDDAEESIIPILPSEFVDQNLEKGDLIISKDSNIGETVLLDTDLPNHMLSGGLLKLSVSKYKYYLLAFLKHEFFKTQLGFKISRGATIKHAKTLFLDCIIPLPDDETTVNYLETLVQLVVNKESTIKIKEKAIYDSIEKELIRNQKPKEFVYEFPRLSSLAEFTRIDAGYYCEDLRKNQFYINNYKSTASTVEALGYEITRGQNLQVSAIGKSIYSDQKKDNFYTLVRPTNLSDYGTVSKYEYLGNENKLETIKESDIVFSAEGSIGKCVVFINPKGRTITNIHGITLRKGVPDAKQGAFVACFLRYLRWKGVLDHLSVGGQGGSLALQYWHNIKIADFDQAAADSVVKNYYNDAQSTMDLGMVNNTDLDTLKKLDFDKGVLQLDAEVKMLKDEISNVVENIISAQPYGKRS